MFSSGEASCMMDIQREVFRDSNNTNKCAYGVTYNKLVTNYIERVTLFEMVCFCFSLNLI